MVKEVKVYEAKDGKQFKTKTGAENHNKKIAVNKVLEELKMTKEEVADALLIISKRNVNVRAFLNYTSEDWTKWPENIISQLKPSFFKEPLKKTVFILKGMYGSETTLSEHEGEAFEDENKYSDEYEISEVLEDEAGFTKNVHLIDKYSEGQRAARKLTNGEILSESEIQSLFYEYDEVYEEEGDSGRWTVSMTTVLDIEGELYAVYWEKGFTENQPNMFNDNPFKAAIEEEEVTIVRKSIVSRE